MISTVRLFCVSMFVAGISGVWASEHDAPEQSADDNNREESSEDVQSFQSLQEVRRRALEHNPKFRSLWRGWQRAVRKVESAGTLPDPKLSYGNFLQSVETRVGPQEQKVGLSQKFPWFGKLDLKEEKAHKMAVAARYRYKQAKLHIDFKVKDAYYDYFYLGRSIAITEEHVKLLKQLESVARTSYEGGGTMSPVVRTQVETGKLEDRLQSLQDRRDAVLGRLNAAMDRPSDAPVAWPESISKHPSPPSVSRLHQVLRKRSPALNRLTALTEKADTAVDLAEKQFWPDVKLGVNYVDTGSAVMSGVDDSGKDPVIAMVSINLPIWQGKYKADKQAAVQKRKATEERRQNIRRTLESRLTKALYKYRDAERKIDLYRDTLIPKAEQELNVSRQAFESGEEDFLSLVDAERSLLQFKLSFEKARAERERQLAKIEMITGRSLQALNKKENKKETNK